MKYVSGKTAPRTNNPTDFAIGTVFTAVTGFDALNGRFYYLRLDTGFLLADVVNNEINAIPLDHFAHIKGYEFVATDAKQFIVECV